MRGAVSRCDSTFLEWGTDMEDSNALVQSRILRDMSEGVLTIGLDGCIERMNPSAERILECPAHELVGKKFAACFFEHEENDAFNQTVLDAIYDHSSTHENIVSFYTEHRTRQLHVTTTFLHGDHDERIALIVVLSDISELMELRDAVSMMEQIKGLNHQLELRNRLLSETFGRFLSDDIVRELLDTPDGLALGGKKHRLTILMSDLRGFTAMSEQMEPQALLAMLNHYLGEMTKIIQSRGGTIIEFIGDGIFAIFGAPTPSDHHAVDAVAAAVEMEAQMNDINVWNEERGYPKLNMGIGIHTGEVIVGNIGSEKRTKYGVVGSNVNLTGRIESYTVGGQILISPDTRASIEAPLAIVQEMRVFPKGIKTGLTLSQVVGIGAPYTVSCPWHQNEPPRLETPITVQFSRITDKHCDLIPTEALLIAYSAEAVVFQTDAALELYDDLRLDLPDEKLFVKVLQVRENGAHLAAVTAEKQEEVASCT